MIPHLLPMLIIIIIIIKLLRLTYTWIALDTFRQIGDGYNSPKRIRLILLYYYD